jgi:hypothetical protein
MGLSDRGLAEGEMDHLLRCSKEKWRGREALVLANDIVRLVTLTGGGHIAEFRFREQSGLPTLNPFWVPPWKTIEPYRYRPKRHLSRYGSPATGRLLSGITGHNLCLDFFGAPSEEEARHGLSIHGEAPSLRWRKVRASVRRQDVRLRLAVRLPAAQLRFERELTLRQGESVAYFREVVTNEKKVDYLFHWTQHVTLGPPFLDSRGSSVWIPARRGRTYPHGYEGKELLESSRNFRWPRAPGIGKKVIDLTQPFIRRGKGFVVTALLNPRQEVAFIAALNREACLIFGYCFRRSDFPWAVTWEENRTRTYPPWNGRCQAHGIEFSSTPFPLPRREAFAQGPLFATPHFSVVPARGSRAVKYLSFLAVVPKDFIELRDLRLTNDEILLNYVGGREAVRVRASGLASMNLVRKV